MRGENGLELFESLQRLCCAAGPSGNIGAVADLAEEMLRPLVDELRRDRLNNVMAIRRCGKKNAKLVLLDAHLDEIGFIVTGHEDGFLRFSTLGGVDVRMLSGRELTLMTQPAGFGVVASKPPHVLSAAEREKAVALEHLRIDVGLTQEEARKRYPIGTTAVYREGLTRLQGSRVTGKALDDRSCFCVLLRALELLKDDVLDVDICVLGSNFEETGGEGALCAAYDLHPDCAVAVDVTFATQPDVSKDKGFPLGAGPVIGVGPNMARWMTQRFKDTAKAEGIAYKLEIMSGDTGTNGWGIQTARDGIATQVLSIPLRYMHTPMEVVDLNDIEQTAKLLAAVVRKLGEEVPEC